MIDIEEEMREKKKKGDEEMEVKVKDDIKE